MSEVGKEDVMAAFVNALSTQIQCRRFSRRGRKEGEGDADGLAYPISETRQRLFLSLYRPVYSASGIRLNSDVAFYQITINEWNLSGTFICQGQVFTAPICCSMQV